MLLLLLLLIIKVIIEFIIIITTHIKAVERDCGEAEPRVERVQVVIALDRVEQEHRSQPDAAIHLGAKAKTATVRRVELG
jgi:hypothetical protein